MAATVHQEAMRDAIAKVLADHADSPAQRGLLTSYVLVAEMVGDDGDPYLIISPDGEATSWRQIGLLEYALVDRKSSIGDDDA